MRNFLRVEVGEERPCVSVNMGHERDPFKCSSEKSDRDWNSFYSSFWMQDWAIKM